MSMNPSSNSPNPAGNWGGRNRAFGGDGNIPDGPRDLYAYTFLVGPNQPTTTLAPAATATFNQLVENDGPFFMTAINYKATSGAAGAQTSLTNNTALQALITLQITDQASQRNYFFSPILLPNIAGDGFFPGRLVHPRKISASGTFTVTLVNADNTLTFNYISLSLIGFKVRRGDATYGPGPGQS